MKNNRLPFARTSLFPLLFPIPLVDLRWFSWWNCNTHYIFQNFVTQWNCPAFHFLIDLRVINEEENWAHSRWMEWTPPPPPPQKEKILLFLQLCHEPHDRKTDRLLILYRLWRPLIFFIHLTDTISDLDICYDNLKKLISRWICINSNTNLYCFI